MNGARRNGKRLNEAMEADDRIDAGTLELPLYGDLKAYITSAVDAVTQSVQRSYALLTTLPTPLNCLTGVQGSPLGAALGRRRLQILWPVRGYQRQAQQHQAHPAALITEDPQSCRTFNATLARESLNFWTLSSEPKELEEALKHLFSGAIASVRTNHSAKTPTGWCNMRATLA